MRSLRRVFARGGARFLHCMTNATGATLDHTEKHMAKKHKNEEASDAMKRLENGKDEDARAH